MITSIAKTMLENEQRKTLPEYRELERLRGLYEQAGRELDEKEYQQSSAATARRHANFELEQAQGTMRLANTKLSAAREQAASTERERARYALKMADDELRQAKKQLNALRAKCTGEDNTQCNDAIKSAVKLVMEKQITVTICTNEKESASHEESAKRLIKEAVQVGLDTAKAASQAKQDYEAADQKKQQTETELNTAKAKEKACTGGCDAEREAVAKADAAEFQARTALAEASDAVTQTLTDADVADKRLKEAGDEYKVAKQLDLKSDMDAAEVAKQEAEQDERDKKILQEAANKWVSSLNLVDTQQM